MELKRSLRTSFEFPWESELFQSPHPVINDEDARDRQERIQGFESKLIAAATVGVIGAGGLGGVVAMGLAMKGVGELRIMDGDWVELSNLNRQWFVADDLHQPKALCLARNAARQGSLGTRCVGHDVPFTPHSAPVMADGVSAVFVGVDSNRCRKLAAQYFRQAGVPAVFSAIDEQALCGWVFLQRPEGACLGCMFPAIAAGKEQRDPCQPSPATLNPLFLVGSFALHALDSILMPRRPCHWNYRSTHLAAGPEVIDFVQPRPGCSICGA